MDEIYKKLKEFCKVRLNEPMSKHCTFRVGGQVRYFVIIEDSDKLIDLLNFLYEEAINYMVVGGCSNLLFSDDFFDGVVIKIKTNKIKKESDNSVVVDAGVPLMQLVNFATQNSLSGLEWGAGIPGSVGGATRGNAGAFGQAVADNIVKVRYWQDGEIFELAKNDCNFVYRGSEFKNDKTKIILQTFFDLEIAEKGSILKAMQDTLSARQGKYPVFPSAGCSFTNVNIEDWPGDKNKLPEIFVQRGKVPAGWMIEQLGFKGEILGGAQVGSDHCNFIVNLGDASQNDILQLVDKIKQNVYEKFGVDLKEEVEII